MDSCCISNTMSYLGGRVVSVWLTMTCLYIFIHSSLAEVNTEGLNVKGQTLFSLVDSSKDIALVDIIRAPKIDLELATTNTDETDDSNSNRKQETKSSNRRSRRHRKDRRRSNKVKGLRRRSCPVERQYVLKTEAEDVYGNIVQVHPVIQFGSLTVDQYFYESFCAKEDCKCGASDSGKFKSSCETMYGYTYARVVVNGKLTWTHIKVRSGCSCVFHEKTVSRPRSILDLL